MKSVSIATLFLLGLIAAKPADELVKELPGQATFDFGVFSGYVPIPGTTKNIHYLLDES